MVISQSVEAMQVMGVTRSASFHPAGSWLPMNSGEQSMRMGHAVVRGAVVLTLAFRGSGGVVSAA